MSEQPHDPYPDTDPPGVTPQQMQADAEDLHTSFADLAALVIGSRGLDELLALVATYAAHAIPGADGAGVALLRVDCPQNRVAALAASHPFVEQIDQIQ
ncbi:hypothetical protein V3G39_09510 [Dermatophilaceae bacterium Sec6.4]